MGIWTHNLFYSYLLKTMKIYRRFKNYVWNHKIISFVVLVIVAVGAYYGYNYFFATSTETTYLISAVEKGTVATTVSGSGQVSAVQQIELKPKASGEVVYVGARAGEAVSAGTVILQIDARDAKIALDSAKLSLNRLTQTSLGSGTVNGLTKDYTDALANVSKTFSDYPAILAGLDDIANDYRVSTYKMNLPDDLSRSYYDVAAKSYWQAQKFYDQSLLDYQKLPETASEAEIIAILEKTYNTSRLIVQATKDMVTFTSRAYDVLDDNNQISAGADRTSGNGWLSTANSDLASLDTSRNALKNSSLDVRAQELSVQQAQNKYNDYFLVAPFDGIVGQLTVDRLDTVSAGSSVGVFASYQKVVNISLNEVDVTHVRVWQKATVTFDAVDGLSIRGTVTELDSVGTISSGVVSYNVKIAFDSQDERVRPGMSASAVITTETKADVLVVPSGAVKTATDGNYVEIVASSTKATRGSKGITLATLPIRQKIKIGIADDNSTEIISGLKLGDKVVTRTINPASATAKVTAPSIFGSSGSSRTTGGGVRTTGVR